MSGRTVRATIGILLALTLAGCGSRAEEGLSRERFVQANVALRQVDRSDPNADSLRQVTLTEHGVTFEELRDFVSVRRDRPRELAEIWDEIHRKLAEAPASDTFPDGSLETAEGRELRRGGTLRSMPARSGVPRAEPPRVQ